MKKRVSVTAREAMHDPKVASEDVLSRKFVQLTSSSVRQALINSILARKVEVERCRVLAGYCAQRLLKVLSIESKKWDPLLPLSLLSDPSAGERGHEIMIHCEQVLARFEQGLIVREVEIAALVEMTGSSLLSFDEMTQCVRRYSQMVQGWNALFELPSINLNCLTPQIGPQTIQERQQALELQARLYKKREHQILEMETQVASLFRDVIKRSIMSACRHSTSLILSDEEIAQRCELAMCRLNTDQCAIPPYTVYYEVAETQSHRSKMEDRHCLIRNPHFKGALIGVFDGHGGSKISSWAKHNLEGAFVQAFHLCNHEIALALQTTLDLLHASSKEHYQDRRVGGSTAIICYFDPEKQLLYTATLGDSAAELWTETAEGLKCTSLSVTQSWENQEDAARAESIAGVTWSSKLTSKSRRLKWKGYGLNVSRALGDFPIELALSREAIISCFPSKIGDTVVIGTDGLWDFLSPNLEEVRAIISERKGVAPRLVELAMKQQNQKTSDNITVVVLHFGGERPQGTSEL